jgi:hypothetical protein
MPATDRRAIQMTCLRHDYSPWDVLSRDGLLYVVLDDGAPDVHRFYCRRMSGWLRVVVAIDTILFHVFAPKLVVKWFRWVARRAVTLRKEEK